jgi:hypothetical protein
MSVQMMVPMIIASRDHRRDSTAAAWALARSPARSAERTRDALTIAGIASGQQSRIDTSDIVMLLSMSTG